MWSRSGRLHMSLKNDLRCDCFIRTRGRWWAELESCSSNEAKHSLEEVLSQHSSSCAVKIMR